MEIEITVRYLDKDGAEQEAKRTAQTFEGAAEDLGKLERFIERVESHD